MFRNGVLLRFRKLNFIGQHFLLLALPVDKILPARRIAQGRRNIWVWGFVWAVNENVQFLAPCFKPSEMRFVFINCKSVEISISWRLMSANVCAVSLSIRA